MALIVESGTGIAGAESYISVVDAHARAALLGWDLPTDETEVEIALRKGALYLEQYRNRIPRRQTDNHSRPSVFLARAFIILWGEARSCTHSAIACRCSGSLCVSGL